MIFLGQVSPGIKRFLRVEWLPQSGSFQTKALSVESLYQELFPEHVPHFQFPASSELLQPGERALVLSSLTGFCLDAYISLASSPCSDCQTETEVSVLDTLQGQSGPQCYKWGRDQGGPQRVF